MSRHESDIRLRHMLDHAKEAVAMASGRTRGELDTDRQLNLSLVRLLEIVGEAAGQARRRKNGSAIPRFRGRRSSACVIGLFMVTIRLTSTSCGRL